MNAVNLIPADSRKRARPKVPVSRPTLGVIGGLVVAIVAVALYASAAHTVSARRSQLAHLRAGVAAWTAAASSYAPYVTAAQQRAQQLSDIRQLVASRFPWENLLGQVAHLLPATAALSTLQASTAPAASSTSASSTTGGSSAAVVPSVQLTGCATSQPAVAETMVRLHQVTGVTDVQLSSSTDSSTPGSSSSGGGPGGCPYPYQFQISLTFSIAAGTSGGTAGTAPTGSAPAPGAASAASAQASSPATAAQAGAGSSPTTGTAQ